MPRPSAHLDRKLIDAARELLPRTGFSGLGVREVARRAGVNPGMFHYHFKSREAFVRRVFDELYGDFLSSFRGAAKGPGTPRERLRAVLVAYALFARRNRTLYSMMVRELLNGEPGMVAFARDRFPEHAGALAELMAECRRAGVVRDLPTPTLCMFAMGSMGLPNVAATGLERSGQKRICEFTTAEFVDRVLSDEMIAVRADMVMAALAPEKRSRK